jgi:hypothetical protein
MVLGNKLNISNQIEHNRVEEKLSKQKAKQLFESGDIDKLEVGTKVAFESFFLYPLRALPVALATLAFLAWHRFSVISASKASSTKRLVSCLSRPISPMRSSGFL